jgi:hypothetical protein
MTLMLVPSESPPGHHHDENVQRGDWKISRQFDIIQSTSQICILTYRADYMVKTEKEVHTSSFASVKT